MGPSCTAEAVAEAAMEDGMMLYEVMKRAMEDVPATRGERKAVMAVEAMATGEAVDRAVQKEPDEAVQMVAAKDAMWNTGG